jgi:class 3 adenylate cyclase
VPDTPAVLVAARPQVTHPHAPNPAGNREAPHPHRRRVAILFADLTGFTHLTETVEPEVVYHTVSQRLDELDRCVHQHGGEIQQVLGDGFMAAFGLHTTRGDEAEQAVGAGRAMLATRPVEPERLDVHVGIEYGEVLVTHPRGPANFGVWGRAVNLARRLCEAATPNQLLIGPALFAHCRHQTTSAAAILLHLHGITRPVVAHRLPPN